MLLTAEQAGAVLTVPGSWLRDKAATREIPCRRLGKHLRFTLTDLTTITEMAARPAHPHSPTDETTGESDGEPDGALDGGPEDNLDDAVGLDERAP